MLGKLKKLTEETVVVENPRAALILHLIVDEAPSITGNNNETVHTAGLVGVSVTTPLYRQI